MNIDFSEARIERLITHHIGNKQREESISLTEKEIELSAETKEHLQHYFLVPMKKDAVFSFTHPVEVKQNDIFTLVQEMFADDEVFIEHSKNIGKLLYEATTHPKVLEGELNIVLFTNVIVGDEMVPAIGIYKSENNVPFIKMDRVVDGFHVDHDFGFEMKGVDKGCLIFNVEEADGYRSLIIDKKSIDAHYWIDDFLKVKPIGNEFYMTNNFLSMTKEFVTNQLPEEYEMNKTDKIDLLNKSVGYFKENDSFETEDFVSEVFVDEEIIDSFTNFKNNYNSEFELESKDSFAISAQAVRKQARVFKSVLKLDKNFHVYIHGDKSLIERGTESDGRKFYKIYYDEEN
jgi:hypothetical protein